MTSPSDFLDEQRRAFIRNALKEADEAIEEASRLPPPPPVVVPPPMPAPPRIATVTPIKKPVAPPRVQAAPTPATVVSAGTVPPPPPPVPTIAAQPTPAPPAEMPVVPPETGHGKTIGSDGQIELFKGCAYIQDINQIMTAEGIELKREPFENDDRFKGRTFVVDPSGKVPTDSAWECFTQSKIISFLTVTGSRFDPTAPPSSVLVRDGLKYINTWRPVDIPCKPGDVSLYTDHIKKLFPKGDDALIYTSFVATCVQNLGVKAAWALFIQGVPGNGKSFLTKVLTYCFGECYVHAPQASTLDRQFNGWMYRKLLICVEEVMVTEGEASTWEKLKTMITETRQEIEGKNANQVTREVCCNYIFNSNHKDGLRKTKEDRRICPLYTAQQSPEDLIRDGMRDGGDSDQSAYFDRLWSWFNSGGAANILHYLRTFPIPDKYNFALAKGGARVAPRTTSTEEALEAGLGAVEQDIKAAIAEGKSGFRGGWISSHALQTLLAQLGKAKFIAPNKRTDMLRELGYVPHPELKDGRVASNLPDGTLKPRLYVKPRSANAALRGAAIADAYLKAQRDEAPDDIPPPPPPPLRMPGA